MQYDEIPKLTKHNIAQHGVIMVSDDRILSYSKTSELPLDSTIIRLFRIVCINVDIVKKNHVTYPSHF